MAVRREGVPRLSSVSSYRDVLTNFLARNPTIFLNRDWGPVITRLESRPNSEDGRGGEGVVVSRGKGSDLGDYDPLTNVLSAARAA